MELQKINEIKKQYLDEFLTQKFVDYGKENQYGESFAFEYMPAFKSYRPFFNGQWKRFKEFYKYDKALFTTVFWLGLESGVKQFKPSDFNWNNIFVEGSYESKEIYKRCMPVIRSFLLEESNNQQGTTTTSGRNGAKYTDTDISSLNALVDDGEGGQVELINLLGADASIYGQYDEYEMNQFLKWLSKYLPCFCRVDDDNSCKCGEKVESKHSIFSKKQLEFLTVQGQYTFLSDEDNGKNEWIGFYADSDNSHHNDKFYSSRSPYTSKQSENYRRNIRERALIAYVNEVGYKEFPSNIEITRDRELSIWNDFMTIVNDEDNLHTQNGRLTRWIVENLDENEVNWLLYDNLSSSHIYDVVGATRGVKMSVDTLAAIVELVEERIVELKEWKVEKVKFYKKENENRLNESQLKKLESDKHKEQRSAVYVYKHGELIRKEMKDVTESNKQQEQEEGYSRRKNNFMGTYDN